jgi:hypothetical protein
MGTVRRPDMTSLFHHVSLKASHANVQVVSSPTRQGRTQVPPAFEAMNSCVAQPMNAAWQDKTDLNTHTAIGRKTHASTQRMGTLCTVLKSALGVELRDLRHKLTSEPSGASCPTTCCSWKPCMLSHEHIADRVSGDATLIVCWPARSLTASTQQPPYWEAAHETHKDTDNFLVTVWRTC